MAIFCGHRKAKMMIDGDFELLFTFDLEFLNNRWANPAQTRAQSASSSLFRGRATAKRCGNDKEVVERVKNMNHFSFGDLPAKSAECPPPPTPWLGHACAWVPVDECDGCRVSECMFQGRT